MRVQFFTVLIAFLQILTLDAQSPSISINARFEPVEASLYKEIRYIIDITNGFPRGFSPPSVPGLRKRGESIYQSSTMINGISTQKVSFIFSYIPEQTGTIEMPKYDIEINGERYPVMPAKVKILNDSNAVVHQRKQGVTIDAAIDSDQAYVGQNIPVTITVRLNEVQLLGAINPKILNDTFLLSPLSKQPKVQLNGDYETYSWNTFITPLKSGNHQVTFEAFCPIQFIHTVGFFSLAEEELVHVISQPVALEVQSLPEAPVNFCGGIGQFALKNLRLSSDRTLIGEPITLSMDIVGEGNFSRLQPPEIASDERWKVFSPRITSVAQDTKTIEYVIVPQKTGEIAIPDIAFTYFNPQTECFETASIDNAKKIVLVSRSAEAFPNYAETENKTNDKNKPKISPFHILSEDTFHHGTLMPIYFQSWFWILQGCLAVVALLFGIGTWKPRIKEKTPKWNIKKIEKSLIQAARGTDVSIFYSLATQFIRQKLATYSIVTEQRSEQIKQLQKMGVKHLKWFESFLNEADAIAFGQSQVNKKHIDQQLEKLLMFLKQP
ncbi:MAG: BatD family protein [Puniceicoccales bacterium]|nr:BatD family protein [Puniceicoccales bacterium]